MGKIAEIVQALIKVFVRSNKRFPQGQELKDIQSQARQVLDGALTHNLDQAKGKNLDDIDVMEKTMDKNADQLIDDYLSNEATKGRMTSEPPTFTVVDQRKLPRAEIEALPLKDKEKAEAAVKKKLEAQNEQARQSREGGETPGGPQRGRPELVDKNFGDTIYIDKSEMKILMDDAYRKFEAAEDAIRRGDYADARGILRYEIEENYKLPQATRDAAYDARVQMRREGGLDMTGYDTEEEVLEVIKQKIDEGIQTTAPDNYPTLTNPEDTSKMKNIEYVDYLDEPGEDFGTPNSKIITPADMDYEFATGGRVGMAAGGIMRLINKLVKTKKMGADRAADLVDLIAQAKKAGVPIKTMNDLENFEKQIRGASGKVYESRKKYPGVEGEKSGLPVILKGKAPKTNLKKVRDKAKADKKNIQELADKNQIPVKDVSFSFADERKRLEELIQKLQTPMLRNDAIDRLKILNFVEDVGGDKAMYDKLRMKKFENLPPKSAYRSDPIAAEEDAERMMSKTQREIDMLTDPDKTVGRKDNAEGGLNYLLGL